MHTITLGTLTAGMVKNNFEEAIKSFVASDNAFSFIRWVKGTPEYWKLFLYDVLAMVKKLGIPNIFWNYHVLTENAKNNLTLLAN